ncbi:O-fucosyltransferase 2 isoform X1 [Cryptomeria japonica]|uniref:O-fucosyltransferase 2 isoform X1 n=1 Tax=Cryptomeria japonica TaxID=3369 RepID=UPI0027DAAA8B|nr:O-fucosyltransferase 2 isoform X1 [Cryptomeria japonica]
MGSEYNHESLEHLEVWSNAWVKRSSPTPRSRQGSPRSPSLSPSSSYSPFRDGNGILPFVKTGSRLSNAAPASPRHSSRLGWRNFVFQAKGDGQGRRQKRRRVRGISIALGLLALFFLLDWWVLSRLQQEDVNFHREDHIPNKSRWFEGEWSKFAKGKRPPRVMYDRLLALAAHALAEGEHNPEPQELWEEPFLQASAWKPCANESNLNLTEHASPGKSTGYILVSANGGLNQQRVAICNAVAVARLLNATLVLPKFLYSSVWKDSSQFGDIYQEDYFINYLKPDVNIVKELPLELQSLDIEAIGSLVTDMDIMKEAKPSFYLTHILPLLLKNRVVHFLGFGNRLSFDPIPFELQRLRCRCNFHALKFIPKIQETGAMLVQRMREHGQRWGPLDQQLMGESLHDKHAKEGKDSSLRSTKYLALHLRFEIDMAAYSMCEFGGEEMERKELQAYRDIHFPTLTMYKKSVKLPSAEALRSMGRCPLTPEEAVLMLAAIGFKRGTHIYLAGAHIYGGQSRMVALTSLYPNLVTKEDLLSSAEIQPFANYSSQLAALDFIGCAAADAFAMTDSGSQLSSLVSGFRTYYGGGRLPTIRPNKKRLAGIFSKNTTIEWNEFQERIRKTVRESKKVQVRPIARSIYRHPRCSECMCQMNSSQT